MLTMVHRKKTLPSATLSSGGNLRQLFGYFCFPVIDLLKIIFQSKVHNILKDMIHSDETGPLIFFGKEERVRV